MSDKTIAVHQPNFIPWIGYFHKIVMSDTFVFLDDVEYTKRGFINRNKVKGPHGSTWLTVPVKASNKDRIMDVRIDNSKDWRGQHLKTFHHFYGKAKYFDRYKKFLDDIYMKEWVFLPELNEFIITKIVRHLDIEVEIIHSSDLNINTKGEERIIDICKKLNANIYFSGAGGKKYMNKENFENKGIELKYQHFEHPTYSQRFGKFIEKLSIIDLIFNEGKETSRKIIKNL